MQFCAARFAVFLTEIWFRAARAHLLEDKIMSTTKEEGPAAEVAGNVQEIGKDLLNTAGAQIGVTAKELSDRAQQLYADFADVVRESTVERPFVALAIAAGAGFILGALYAANRSASDDNRGGWRDRD